MPDVEYGAVAVHQGHRGHEVEEAHGDGAGVAGTPERLARLKEIIL